MACKLPVLERASSKEGVVVPDLRSFQWTEVLEKRRLGEGSFGDVFSGEFNGRTVVVKKMKRQQKQREKDMFVKEVCILKDLKCKNIVRVEGFCPNPVAVMLEYVYFDFQPLGIQGDRVTSLTEFLEFICTGNFVEELSSLQVKIAQDVSSAIAYLHKKDIVHRDIKPANVLVSNTHYCHLTDRAQIEQVWLNEGIVCKLADFGESRSSLNQTAVVNHTRTTNFERGTVVYNPPEMLTAMHGASFSLEDLKRADVWSLGMLMFVLMNPDLEYPYAIEMEKESVSSVLEAREALHCLMCQNKKPTYSEKYSSVRAVDWIKIDKAFQSCTSFQSNKRVTANEALKILGSQAISRCIPVKTYKQSFIEGEDVMAANRPKTSKQFIHSGDSDQEVLITKTFAGETDKICQKRYWSKRVAYAAHVGGIKEIISEVPVVLVDSCISDEELSIVPSNKGSKEQAADNPTDGRRKDPVAVGRSSEGRGDSATLDQSNGGRKDSATFDQSNKGRKESTTVGRSSEGRKDSATFGQSNKGRKESATIGRSSEGRKDSATFGQSNKGRKELATVGRSSEGRKDSAMFGQSSKGRKDSATVGGSSEGGKNSATVDQSNGGRKDAEMGSNALSKSLSDGANMHKAHRKRNTSTDDESSSDYEVTVNAETFKPSGEPYKRDSMTPVFSWNKTAYTSEQLVCLLLGKYEPEQTCISQPINVSHNVSFLVDINSLQHRDDLKCDDMGAWKHNGSPKCLFHVEKDSQGIKKICAMGRTSSTPTQHATDDVYELRRTYYKNCSDEAVRKIVSKLHDNCGNTLPYVLVQYLFSGTEHEVKRVMPHGNSKFKSSYRRLLPSTREKLKKSVFDKEKTAKEALDEVYRSSGDVTMARSLSELPRGPSDLYNARHSAKQSCDYNPLPTERSKTGESSQNVNLDNVWTLLERAKREEEESEESVFIRECSIHPDLFVVIANDQQLHELVQFCTNPRKYSVFGIDPTFNIFDRNISLTVTTYRNLKLENPNTGKPPVFIGPLLMHQRKDWKTYSKFAHALATAKPELEGILACGTDGEKALIDGFKRNMRFAIFLRCFLHFKDNIKRELIDRGITGDAKNQFISEVFGKQEGPVKYFGLVDCESEDEFDTKLQELKPEWEERETAHGNEVKKQTFFEWFQREKATDIKESMLRPVRREAGLGNPPSEYTNNDPEAANFIIKHGLHFNANKPHEFIDKIKNIIETQQRNEDRAVFGRGPYRVRKGFTHLTVDDVERSHLSHAQMTKKLMDFKKAGMNSMNDVISSIRQDLEEEPPASRLSITAEESGITTIPAPILDAMFEKASNLLASQGSVIAKPGASDESFIVAGTSNNVHSVSPGEGGCLSCDRTCINHATKICEHVLAVAQVKGTLNEFITWFKRKRKRPTMMDMVEQRGPKNVGKKPSGRKRTNAKAQPINEYVDLLGNDASESRTSIIQPPPKATTTHQYPVPFPCRPMPTSLATSEASPIVISHQHQFPTIAFSSMPSSVERSGILQRQSPTTAATFSNPYPSMATGFSFMPPTFGSCGIPQMTASPNQYHSTPFRFSSVSSPVGASSSTNSSNQSTTSVMGQARCMPTSFFYLKWVQGTKVSKCYGCSGDIQNPPMQRPDNLIIVCRDVREYRDKATGQLQRSSTPQNVHFHLRKECILVRYPRFHTGLLVVVPEFLPLLQQEHIQRLSANFGWSTSG